MSRLELRTAVACLLAAAFAIGPASRVVSGQGWSDSYRAGFDAWRTGNWELAETKLKDALSQRPEQGRRVPVTGTPGIVYVPEFYLGLVYVNLKRFAEAARLLNNVKTAGLVAPQHPEFDDLQRALDACRRGDLASFQARTVKIDTVKSDGEAEAGTGIVVHVAGAAVHLLTALHVLVPPEELPAPRGPPREIKVAFHPPAHPRLPGQLDGEWQPRKFDVDLDLALVRVAVPRDSVPVTLGWEFRLGTPLQKMERIFTVGHAIEDYGVSETNVVLNPVERDSRRFTISTAGIGQMASGGPVIDDRGYLAGIMTLLYPNRASAVHVSEVARLLKIWLADVGPEGTR